MDLVNYLDLKIILEDIFDLFILVCFGDLNFLSFSADFLLFLNKTTLLKGLRILYVYEIFLYPLETPTFYKKLIMT